MPRWWREILREDEWVRSKSITDTSVFSTGILLSIANSFLALIVRVSGVSTIALSFSASATHSRTPNEPEIRDPWSGLTEPLAVQTETPPEPFRGPLKVPGETLRAQNDSNKWQSVWDSEESCDKGREPAPPERSWQNHSFLLKEQSHVLCFILHRI